MPTGFDRSAADRRDTTAIRPARRAAAIKVAIALVALATSIGIAEAQPAHRPATGGLVGANAPATADHDPRPPAPTAPSIAVPTPAPTAQPKPVSARRQPPRHLPPRHLPPPRTPVTGAALPSPQQLLSMIRGVLSAVNQANFTNDYSVLHALGTRELQLRTTPASFGQSFAQLRKHKLDLSPALILPVQFVQQPRIGPDGMMRLAGIFPTRPLQIEFAIVYYPIAGFWRIDSLTVTTTNVAPQAASQPAVPVAVVAPATQKPRLPKQAAHKQAMTKQTTTTKAMPKPAPSRLATHKRTTPKQAAASPTARKTQTATIEPRRAAPSPSLTRTAATPQRTKGGWAATTVKPEPVRMTGEKGR